MEGEVDAGVAPSILLPGKFSDATGLARKRDFTWRNRGLHRSSHHQQKHLSLMGSGFTNPGNTDVWSPKLWDWDSLKFTAKPSGVPQGVGVMKDGDGTGQLLSRRVEEDSGTLNLKIGMEASAVEKLVFKPNKQIWSGSPGSSAIYPMCQVDAGRSDLSNATAAEKTSSGQASSLHPFKDPGRESDNQNVKNLTYRRSYLVSSSSEHSPSNSRFDAPDRTGRIIFKLFDKDPSNLPGELRTEILSWLSHTPSEIESYIRPGCVVLSIYLCMTLLAWHELVEDFLRQVNSLVNCSESGFWKNTRFLVRLGRQLASHRDVVLFILYQLISVAVVKV